MRLFGQNYTFRRLDLRRRMGVVPENHPVGVWRSMTAWEYLAFFADLFEVDQPANRIHALLEQLGLSEATHRRISGFSRGMLQKLSFARALLPDPDLLLLDEPISGLDPVGIKQVRDLITAQNRRGKTIFISSHLLTEMERICSRVAIVSAGRLVAQGTVEGLLESLPSRRQIQVELERIPPDLIGILKELDFVTHVEQSGKILAVSVSDVPEARKLVAEHLYRLGLVPLGIRERDTSLEDAFMTITQERVRELTGGGAREGGPV
jgi:ABC-2 type transport system ATP-binding protein